MPHGNGSTDALLDAAPCGLVRTRSDGTITLVNQTFCNWTGFSAKELVGEKEFRDVLTVGGRIFHHTHWLPLLQMQGSIAEVKLDVVTRGGETVPMLINAVLQVDGDEVFHLIATFVAHDRNLYERELLEARKRLKRSVDEARQLHEVANDRALLAEQMMGIVGHDLRNPLGIIKMSTELLRRGALTENQKTVVARMHRATEQSLHLIADLLDFTQARLGGGLTVSTAVCDLHQVVADTVEELKALYPTRVLHHRRAGDGPCEADSFRLGQLIGNLVSNAVAYGVATSPITVTSSVAADACSVSVHNDGEPIPPSLIETIFSPMKRGSDAHRSSHSIGLGLYIVKMIAAAHGGDARVESTETTGTTFVVTFPSKPAQSPADATS